LWTGHHGNEPGPLFTRLGRAAGAATIDSDGESLESNTRDELAERVVAAVLGGDRDAFRPLIERESSAVVRTCYRILGNLPDAEDAAQESFVTAYRALATWRREGPFGAWMARIAVRVAIRHSNRRGKTRELTWIDPPDAANDGSAPTRSSHLEDPEHHALLSERALRVREALARLDDSHREVVALRFFGDLSLAEIATTIERPVNTVKTQLYRGLQRLRDDLELER